MGTTTFLVPAHSALPTLASANRFCAPCSKYLLQGAAALKLTAHRPRHLLSMRAHAGTEESTRSEQEIEKLDRSYCDDFECTSSPAVENSVRSLARDLELGRNSLRLFDQDIRYDDGFRQCTGSSNAAKQQWIKDTVAKPSVTVSRIQMIDKGSAQIDWRLVGELNGNALDIQYSTEITVNVLTGRITSLKETWDLSKCSAATALRTSGSRVAYSAKLASRDAKEGLSKIGDAISSTLSVDDNSEFTQDPTDPTKYYQQDNQAMQDYINYALIVAMVYLVYKGFEMTAM